MPLRQKTLALSAEPRSVQEARRWVAGKCAQAGRDDLVDSAELGVSELVTNALLHGKPPLSVSFAGTVEHPRVEVADGSQVPPLPPAPVDDANDADDELDELLATFGRGLRLVAMSSVAWGAAIEEWGKVVWFEPADAPRENDYPAAEIIEHVRPDQAEPEGVLRVAIAGVPVQLMVLARRHYGDLRRELRLLSLAHQDDYPLAASLTEAFSMFEQAMPRSVDEQAVAASLAGAATFDLDVRLAEEAPRVIEQMLELLDLADEFCRAQRLLSLARSAEQRDFQQWFYGEFIAQAQGDPPTAWSGVVSRHVS